MLLTKAVTWTLVAVILAPPVIYTAFLVLASARRILAAGARMPAGMRLVCRFWLIVGAPADALFNATYAWVRFGERPREIMFSSRIERYMRGPDGRQKDRARPWADMLNAAWPEHIK